MICKLGDGLLRHSPNHGTLRLLSDDDDNGLYRTFLYSITLTLFIYVLFNNIFFISQMATDYILTL